ncbi:MAG TPA: O-antigen translocase [Verrucomicrobiae bacterium]|nr:O-antigen translocase [Verrucomicrobiae bacterium]
MSADSKTTYGEIVKSSTIIGGSSVIVIVLRVVQTKVMALLLGPAGVGLMGLYGSIIDFACTIGSGVNNSGVRQIAESAGTNESHRIAGTVTTLRRVVLILALLTALLLAAASKPVARLTFGDEHYSGAVALLSLAILLTTVSGGQAALVQGMRRIYSLARINVLGALFALVVNIPIIYWYRQRGIVPSLVCTAAMSFLFSWWYARQIKVDGDSQTRARATWSEARALLQLGIVFMATGLMTMGAAYLIRMIVLRSLGVDAAGFYQSAWALGGLYVGFILGAMGADFYPRLTAAANDHAKCNRLANEQVEVGMLMAGPGVLGTLTFAPLVMTIFYSAKFGPAAEILRWICLGMLLRVVTWPMGFILLAKGDRKRFFYTETAANVTHVTSVWLGVRWFGLNGAGVAFFGLYLFYWVMMSIVVYRLTGFRWSSVNRQIGLLYGSLVLGVFCVWYLLPRVAVLVIGAAATVFAGLYSVKTLCRLVPGKELPPFAQKALLMLGLTSSRTAG